MAVLQVGAMVLLQDNELTRHDIHLAMIFLAVIALALLAQALFVGIAMGYAAKLLHRVDGIANRVEQKTAPILDKTNAVLLDLAPKIQSVTNNVEQMSYAVRAKVDELGATVSELNRTVQDANGRTRAQVARVDGMVSDALQVTEEVSATVQQGIRVPLRQIEGIIAGLKAGLETLVARSPFGK
jgi:uncharacterized protein YoxC